MSLLLRKQAATAPVDPIQRLQNESESAISIFRDTVEKLTSANTSVEAEEEKELAAKAEIEARLSNLGKIKSKNQNFITKINNLFE